MDLKPLLDMQLFGELESEMMCDIEGPQEMFHLEEGPMQWSAAASTSHESVTYNSTSHADAPGHAAYDGWSGNPLGISHDQSAAQHGSSRGIEILADGMQRQMHLSSNRRNSTDSNSSFGDMPRDVAEQVCFLCFTPARNAPNMTSANLSLSSFSPLMPKKWHVVSHRACAALQRLHRHSANANQCMQRPLSVVTSISGMAGKKGASICQC